MKVSYKIANNRGFNKIFILIIFICAVSLFLTIYRETIKDDQYNPEGTAYIIELHNNGGISITYANKDAGSKTNKIKFLNEILPFIQSFDKHNRTNTSSVKELSIDSQRINNINNNEISSEDVITYKNISKLKNMNDLKKYLYSIDKTAFVAYEDIRADKLLSKELKTDLKGTDPKILIFHTHSKETFADSEQGILGDTIVGMGERLAAILAYEYNISVVHDKSSYDLAESGGELRGSSYEVMGQSVEKILKEYPSVEVVIDLHRDGLPEGLHLTHEIDGVSIAKIMYFNGICRLNDNGEPVSLPDLPNPYLEDNLAFSLKMQLKTNELYPGLARRIYIKPYRYSLYFKPKSLLVEAGANTNTVSEVSNLMPVLANVLVNVLES